MCKELNKADILYVNKLSNIVYTDGDILETSINKSKKDTMRDTIFDIFARILTKNSEQRKVLFHIIFDKEEYNRNSLCKKLNMLYGKSTRTYERAIDYLFGRKLIYYNKHKALQVPLDYNLDLLDLDNIKSIIIHIN